jgi:ATP-dependent Lon protease
MVQIGHLFAPMPDIIRDDMAYIDRLHFYLPGWEVPKLRNETSQITTGSWWTAWLEALGDFRRLNFTEAIDHHFSLGRTSTPETARPCGGRSPA